jgi:hypothetical protein
MMDIYIKTPTANLDYSISWEDWLQDGETISASTWSVPTGITKGSDSFGDSAATIWVTDGTDGEDYDLINYIVTSAGRKDDRTIKIKVRAKR